jgi:hypothetical protein
VTSAFRKTSAVRLRCFSLRKKIVFTYTSFKPAEDFFLSRLCLSISMNRKTSNNLRKRYALFVLCRAIEGYAVTRIADCWV